MYLVINHFTLIQTQIIISTKISSKLANLLKISSFLL